MILTDEEIRELELRYRGFQTDGERPHYYAKAQLKKVVEELRERLEQMGTFDHEDHPYNTNPNKDTRWHFSVWKPQDEWENFWQSLLKEVE